MVKKLTLALLISLVAIAAQAAVGSWKIHPVYGATPTNAIDTGEKVYYLASSNLYCYDKETQENAVYDRSNYLNDSQVNNIYYNYDKKYLLVAYSNSNIDIVLADGKVVNVPDIYNALLTTTKTINHVTFCSDGAYIATAFGYVKLNDDKYEVAESRIYNVNITSAARVGNTLMLGSASGLYYGSATKQHSTLATMSTDASLTNSRFYPLQDNAFILYSSSAGATYTTNTDDSGNITFTKLATLSSAMPTLIQPVKSLGTVIALYNNVPNYYSIALNGTTATAVTLPSTVKSELVTSQESDGSWWSIGSNGLRKLTISGTTATTVIDYQKLNTSTVSRPVHLAYNTGLNMLYVSNSGKNALYGTGQTTTLNTLDANSNWSVISPTVSQNRNPSTKYLYNTYRPVFDPEDSNSFYVGSEFEGVFKFTNNEQVAHWDWTNSPLPNYNNYCCTVSAYDFDKAGNLWVIEGDVSSSVYVLPRDKVKANSTSKDDWIKPNMTLGVGWRQTFLITKKSDIKVYNNGNWGAAIVFFSGDPTGTITKTYFSNNKLLDQDNRTISWAWNKCIAEDNNGYIWAGTDQGIYRMDPVAAISSTDTHAYRPKVPRNDGTNNADYLLDGVQVNAIAVDGTGRLWIGTENSGLYLVSSDGTEIIEQFTTANSVLPADKIISLACNPNTNAVYVGTESGMLEYESDSTAPSANYDDVYVYPNPVRPDYTGLITIKGLMDNSLVKIADASGSVVAQLQSNGGMATWDGCGENGDRVKSGVYFVLASENESGSSHSVVAKFLIVR